MPEFGVNSLDALRLALAWGHVMVARIVHEALLQGEGIGIIRGGLRTAFNQTLHVRDVALPHDIPSQPAPCVPVYLCDEIRSVFYA